MRTPLTADAVAARMADFPSWEAEGAVHIYRKLTFRDHIEAAGFVMRVAIVAEVLDHHPDLRLVYNRVELTLSTHDPGGVTQRDFDLAKRIDALLA